MRCILALGIALLCAVPAAAGDPSLRKVDGAQTDVHASGHLIADLDGDGADEITLLGWDGRVRVLRGGEDGALSEPLGQLTLPHPERSVVGLGHVAGDERTHLFVVSPDGVSAYPSVPGDGFAVRPVRLARRARFTLRTRSPRVAPITRELNDDNLTDVVVPYGDRCEIWLQEEAADGGGPRLVRAATVKVDVRDATETAGSALTDVLESSFTIPDLRIEDVNGDGRRDVLVADGDIRAFHLQHADGTFPEDPDVRVDLEMFRDTTPEADVLLGRTLAGNDDQRYESRDLDGDGIPDHVIAHRRKVWVFLGGPDGPQFENPVAILKTAEDVTALLLVRVDSDPLPDLVLVRLQVPTAATLIRGLLSQWDVELSAAGYRGRPKGGFDTAAGWRGELTVRLPALLGVLRDPDALIRRFEDMSKQFGKSVTGDLDGDGVEDILLIDDEDAARLDLWLGVPDTRDDDAERLIGRVLFEDAERTWTLERMLGFLGDLAQRRAARLTGGRDPSGSAGLRTGLRRRAVVGADLDGDGRDEVVALYDGSSGAIVDVLGWR